MQGHMLSKLREQYIGSVFSTNCPSTYALCKKKKNKKTAELRSCITWEGKLEGWGKSLFKDTGLFLDIDQHINNISVYLQKKKNPYGPTDLSSAVRLLSIPQQVLTQFSCAHCSF